MEQNECDVCGIYTTKRCPACAAIVCNTCMDEHCSKCEEWSRIIEVERETEE